MAVASRFETVAGRIRLGIADRDSNSCRSIGAVRSGCRVLTRSRLLMCTEARRRQEEQADDRAGLLESKRLAGSGI